MPRPRVAAVLLAAGSSRRMGRPKQLIELEGEPLVRRAARVALASRCDALFVVVGAAADEVREALAGLDFTAVENPAHERGLAGSIRAGVGAAADFDAVLLLLADQPRVGAAALDALLAAWDGTPGGAAASAYGGGLGVPALLGSAHFGALGALEGDAGARGLLRGLSPPPARVALPEAAWDVDTPEDLRALDPGPSD